MRTNIFPEGFHLKCHTFPTEASFFWDHGRDSLSHLSWREPVFLLRHCSPICRNGVSHSYPLPCSYESEVLHSVPFWQTSACQLQKKQILKVSNYLFKNRPSLCKYELTKTKCRCSWVFNFFLFWHLWAIHFPLVYNLKTCQTLLPDTCYLKKQKKQKTVVIRSLNPFIMAWISGYSELLIIYLSCKTEYVFIALIDLTISRTMWKSMKI